MTSCPKRALFLNPRILSIIFIAFLSLFGLGIFDRSLLFFFRIPQTSVGEAKITCTCAKPDCSKRCIRWSRLWPAPGTCKSFPE
jgi:hypothetical protein